MKHNRNELLRFDRRKWMQVAAASTAMGVTGRSWLSTLAADTTNHPQRRRSCILLWMPGGPSQTDTFDMKPNHANGGLFKSIPTTVPGIHVSEHMPLLAKQMEHMAIIRSMHTHEADHDRAAFYLRTGYKPQAGIQYPSLGSLVAHEFDDPDSAMPGFVSVAAPRLASDSSNGSGYLGPNFSPMLVGNTSNLADFANPDRFSSERLSVPELHRPASLGAEQYAQRLAMLSHLQQSFASKHPGLGPSAIKSAQERAIRLAASPVTKAFDLSNEPQKLRDEYGMNIFGQSCLLARRLVEKEVPFIEVTLGGWDTHIDNFTAVEQLTSILDRGWGTLMRDLADRGLLDSTLIVWMGEFGRTPTINPQAGRDHFPNAWSTVLAGGGIQGGQAYGSTSEDGTEVEEDPVGVPDLLATVCKAIGIDPLKQLPSNVGRPIRIVDKDATPIEKVLS